MAKRPPQIAAKVHRQGTVRQGPAGGPPPALTLPMWSWLGGSAAILAAIAASGALVWQHFSGRALPGCGPQSGCASIESHPLGKVPFPAVIADLLGVPAWPSSFLGLTFFLAIFGLWVASARTLTLWLRLSVWAGIAVSVVYLVAIAVKIAAGDEPCKYCLASHAANFLLFAFMEIGMMMVRRAAPSAATPLAPVFSVPVFVAAAMFVGATTALGYAERGKVSREAVAAEAARAEAEQAMIAQAAAAKSQPAPAGESWSFGPQGFTGRYREGPEKAVVRLVIFSDYQCQQCKRIETEARALRAKYPDKVSISHKHYPWCSDCNKYLNGQTLHANACWAARAAETAALLKGNDGFWQMHRWLFDRGGGFTDQELNAGLAQLGYDAKVFLPVMTGEGTLRPVQQDVDEAQALGISGTPMVFINGVELKGWEAPRALERTVEAVLSSGADPATSAGDRPVLAREKYLADWRDEPVRSGVAGPPRRELAADNARVEIVIFGDFLEPNTAKADAQVRQWIASGAGGKPVRYVFRHFPGDKTCNPAVGKTFFEHGCLAASTVEAASLAGGNDAYWKMHAWILANQKTFGPANLAAAAAAAGIDSSALSAAMQRPEVRGAIDADLAAARQLNVNQIPCIYVNGKFVKRWWREGDNVLERIVDEAASK